MQIKRMLTITRTSRSGSKTAGTCHTAMRIATAIAIAIATVAAKSASSEVVRQFEAALATRTGCMVDFPAGIYR